MKRLMLFVLFVAACINTVWGQAYEGSIKYNKKTHKAVLIDYAYPAEAVENAIIEKMAQHGYKHKEEKGIFNSDRGFLVFKNAHLADVTDEAHDYIVKVERKGKKDSDLSTLYLILAKSDVNSLERFDLERMGNVKSFLHEGLLPHVESAHLELQIKAQEDIIAKAEKKLKGLKDDQASLEKKLADNKKDQENTEKDIENQKQALETLISKRAAN